MKLYPVYSENIIVYVLSGGAGAWYVTDKEMWFLDRVALSKAFGRAPEQEDIELLHDLLLGNGKVLISKIKGFEVTTEELMELIQIYPSLSEDESILEMRPSVYIDLDKKTLKNIFPEPSGVFEKYAPESWSASFEDFWHLIPKEKAFWVINGQSQFDENA